jgi:hypothetical protein
LLESREVPIALAGDCPELFENNTLCGRYFSGEDCFDSVFDTSIRPKHGYTVFRVPQKYNFSLMPSNNQVFEIDHHTPLAEAQGTDSQASPKITSSFVRRMTPASSDGGI